MFSTRIVLLYKFSWREMADETDILNSLIWDKTEKRLAKFLKHYELPLLVKVVKGFYCNNEDACIYDEQILALHKTHSTPKLIGTDVSGSQVSIALSCPIPVLVYPAKCKYSPCKVEDFKSLFSKVQYVRVKSCGAEEADGGQETSESSLKIGDFLQIKTIDTKNRNVLCQNVYTKDNLYLPYTSPATFTPLLDYRQYTLSEVVSNFSLPVKVTFEVKQTVQDSYEWNNALSGLTEVILHKEVKERAIIATTVGGVGEIKHCLGLPIDLPIRCTVPEPLTKYGGTFVDVTRWLRSLSASLNSDDIKERINVFNDKNIVKIYDFMSSSSPTTLRRPRPETLPGLVRNPARRLIAPHVSPRKKKSANPQDPKHFLQGSSKDRSRSEPDSRTTTDEVYPENLSRSRSENSATIADLYEDLSGSPVIETSPTISEDDYMDMASLYENAYENPDFVMDKKFNTMKNPYLSKTLPAHNSSANESSIKPTPLKNPDKKTMRSVIKRTQGYEEVEPKWNKQVKQQFAVPRFNPNETRKEQFSQEDSEYVIPMISANVQPKKFEIRKQPETKGQTSSGYENVDLNFERNKQKDKERKSPYENVFLNVESDSEKFENFEEYEDVKPRNIQNVQSKFENGPFASAEVMQFLHLFEYLATSR